jgi:hypothetical protein
VRAASLVVLDEQSLQQRIVLFASPAAEQERQLVPKLLVAEIRELGLAEIRVLGHVAGFGSRALLLSGQTLI